MTTQTPQPETTQDPVVERVSRLEGIAEETRHRLDDLSRGQTTILEKIDRQGDAIRAEMRQGDDAIRAEHRADYQALDAKIDRLRADLNRQTYLIIGGFAALAAFMSALAALFTFLG